MRCFGGEPCHILELVVIHSSPLLLFYLVKYDKKEREAYEPCLQPDMGQELTTKPHTKGGILLVPKNR